jgi:hypothetical protein
MDQAMRDVPSPALRASIVEATHDGLALERQVVAFATTVRRLAADFAAEVDPLGLSDDDHGLVAGACGLRRLFAVAYRMEQALAEVAEAP